MLPAYAAATSGPSSRDPAQPHSRVARKAASSAQPHSPRRRLARAAGAARRPAHVATGCAPWSSPRCRTFIARHSAWNRFRIVLSPTKTTPNGRRRARRGGRAARKRPSKRQRPSRRSGMLASISSLTRKRGLRARGLPSQWRRSACRARSDNAATSASRKSSARPAAPSRTAARDWRSMFAVPSA